MKRRELLKLFGFAGPALALESPVVLGEGVEQTPAERAAGVMPKNGAYPPLNVRRYGAVGDGQTDDRAAVKAAWLVATEQAGGTIVFPDAATYLISSVDPASPLKIPQQQADGSVKYLPYQTQLYFQNGSGVVFEFRGSTLKTTLTGGGAFIVLDGCNNIRMDGPKIVGPQVQSTGIVSLGTITGGTDYINGTYDNVRLTGGSGGGAIARIVVSGGAVQSVTVIYPGGQYAVNDTLSCAASSIGGRGSGFSASVTSVAGAGPKVLVAAPNAILCTALSRSSANITITDLDVSSMYTAFYAVADPNTANTVSHISLLGHTRFMNGEYGVALHDSGDDTIIENLYTYRANRPFFFYGVERVRITAVGDQNAFGFQPIVKAYRRSTRDITIKYSAINQPGQSESVPKMSFQVQHDPAVIDPPPTVQGVYLDYSESNVTGGGYGIQFDYYAGTSGQPRQSASSHLLFDNFVIRGFSNNSLLTTVDLRAATTHGRINVDGFRSTKPKADHELSNNGFAVSGK